jgi:Rap1a immunity proteins
MKIFLTFSVSVFLITGNIYCTTLDGLRMLNALRSYDRGCKTMSDTEWGDWNYVMGLIAGTISAGNGRLFDCSQNDGLTISYGQASEIVKKYLNDNPKKLNELDASLVLEALEDAYPISKK